MSEGGQGPMEVARLAGLAGRRLARAGCAAWRSARPRAPERLVQ